MSVEQSASLVVPGTAALQVAYVQEMGACAEASGGAGGSSAQVNAAPEEACVVTFGPAGEVGDTAADGLPDTSLTGQVEAGRGEGQSPDPVEDSLRQGSGLVVHWGVLGRTGGHHWEVKAEVGPSPLGGWRWELKKSRRGNIYCILNWLRVARLKRIP